MKYIKLFENFEVINEEFEDLELKNIGKRLFSVAKEYGLKPQYQTKTVNFESKPLDAELGYGAKIVVADGMLTIGIYDRGVIQSIRRGGFPGVEKNETAGGSDDPTANAKALNKALTILFEKFTAVIPQDKFETQNTGNKPNEFGFYIIRARLKK